MTGYRPRNKARHAGGRDINDVDYYDHWADLHRITQAIKGLKADLKRDCIPYYKYDELCKQISGMQIKIKLKDELKHG
jgi:hypothetical protein